MEWDRTMLLATNKGGTVRFWVHFRHLNAVMILDPFGLPRIADGTKSLGNASLFKTLGPYGEQGKFPSSQQIGKYDDYYPRGYISILPHNF